MGLNATRGAFETGAFGECCPALSQGYVKVIDPSGILLLEYTEAVEDTRWILASRAR
jgi:hypothetical protein